MSRPPAILGALLPKGADTPSAPEAIALLKAVPPDEVGFEVLEAVAEGASSEAIWRLQAVLRARRGSEPLPALVWLERTRRRLLGGIGSEVPEAARASEHTLCVGATLGDRPLDQYHALTKLLHRLAPDPAAVLEPAAVAVRPSGWLAEVASARTPPSPMTLFNIHMVGDQKPGELHWLHTHGLERCGIIDLEMFDVPFEGCRLLAQLVNSVAGMFMDDGVPPPEEPFVAGLGLTLVWFPWDEAMRRFPPVAGGGPQDREGEDDEHRGPRGVLFAPRRRWLFWRRYESPASYLPILEGNPILYISSMETERLSQLAAERLPRFLDLLERFGGKEKWVFVVKLGYPVDGAETPDQREHLWFEVHGRTGPRELDATLVNAPYAIAAMHEGDRGRRSLDALTEWAILCEHGRFDADTVGRLEEVVGGAS